MISGRCFILWVLILLLLPLPAHAQVSLDGSMGPAGNLTGPDYQIPDSLGLTRGTNLFHSFSQFDIGKTESATFTGPDTIANIFSRVTGGEVSVINGLLKSEMPNADLYLFNPAGVLFGPNTTLDLPGAFFTGTADYITLGQDGVFHTSLSGASVLTSSAPAAFGFLDDSPAEVVVYGSLLAVAPGEQMGIVAGDTYLDYGFLSAKNGRIDLAAVASAGEVALGPDGITTSGIDQMGYLSLTSFSSAYASSDGGGEIYIRAGELFCSNSKIMAETLGSGSAGLINIQTDGDMVLDNEAKISTASGSSGSAGDITIDTAGLEINGDSVIQSSGLDIGPAGDVTITASDRVEMTGLENGSSSGIFAYASAGNAPAGDITITTPDLAMATETAINARALNSGKSGTITLDTQAISMSDSAQVLNSTVDGHGGDIIVTATDSVTISGGAGKSPSGFFSDSSGSGNGGNIIINTGTCQVDGGEIRAGALDQGDAGSVSITTDTLSLLNGGAVDAFTKGAGNAGGVDIQASESILVSGFNSDGYDSRISTYTNGGGKGGSLSLTAPDITITNRAVILNRTWQTGQGGNIEIKADTLSVTGLAQISCSTFGSAPGGDLIVTAGESVTLSGSGPIQGGIEASGLFAATEGDGPGGSVKVNTPLLQITDGGLIQGTSIAGGMGGDIVVDADTVSISGGGVITSGAEGTGDGGSITITAGKEINMTGKNNNFYSGLFVNTSAGGDSGDINIQAPDISISDQAAIEAGNIGGSGLGGDIVVWGNRVDLSGQGSISTRSTGTGDAGNISITAPDYLFLDHGRVTTEANFSDGGNISVQAGNLLRLVQSDITATVGGGLGNGGNIDIDPTFIVLDRSRIIANAFQGNGGNITLVGNYFFSDPFTLISASSQLGIDGTVAIETPNIDLSAAFSTLPEYSQIPELDNDRCQSGEDAAGSLVRSGRGGLPPGPFAAVHPPLDTGPDGP